jgi:hypothetical protein
MGTRASGVTLRERPDLNGGTLTMMKTPTIVVVLLLLAVVVAYADDQSQVVQPADVYTRSAKIALATDPPDYDRALRNLYTARENYPDNSEVHFLLGSIWADKDEIDGIRHRERVAENVEESGEDL